MRALSDKILDLLITFLHEKLRLSPNQVSTLGFVIGIAATFLVAWGSLLTGMLMLGLSQIVDGLDGGVARKYNLQSADGERLDTIYDRINELAIFIALAYIGQATWTITILAFVAILLITVISPKSGFDPGFKRITLYFGYLATILFHVPGFQYALNVVFFANLTAFAVGTIMVDYRFQREIDAQAILRREREREMGDAHTARRPAFIAFKNILMKLAFAGIRRKTEFSPNHVVNDQKIIDQTAEALRALGAAVTMYDEGTFTVDAIKEQYIFSMVQGPNGSRTLQKIEAKGAMAINSAEGVINCYRINMVTKLPAAGIPFPKSVIISTDSERDWRTESFSSPKVWIKRGDVHAVHKEDVTLASTDEEKSNLLKEYQQRDIVQAILQEHLDGDTVKFYALRGSELFHWYYLNGVYHTKFDERKLRDLAVASAEALQLHVFGGDAIIGRDGSITIIDINDWPSFAPIRDEASKQIAQLIYNKAKEYVD